MTLNEREHVGAQETVQALIDRQHGEPAGFHVTPDSRGADTQPLGYIGDG